MAIPQSKIILGLTLLLALVVKLHYSVATADDLVWVLAPTTWLVELFSAIPFHFEVGRGYVTRDLPVVIGPGCAGLNFFIITLCASLFTFIDRFAGRRLIGWALLVLLAYLLTLLVNAFRIVGGILLLRLGSEVGLQTDGLLHSAQGMLFFFSFLVLYLLLLQRFFNKRV
ncbi:MAG: exosortase K [Chromatiales bacterium]|nr:exosortase K [Chromatiales bacterium]